MKIIKKKRRDVEDDAIAHGATVVKDKHGVQKLGSMLALLRSEGHVDHCVSPARLRRVLAERGLGDLISNPTAAVTHKTNVAETIQLIYNECGNIGFRGVANELVRRGVVASYSHEAVRRTVINHGINHGERTDIISDDARANILKLYCTTPTWTPSEFIDAVRAAGVDGFCDSTILNVIYAAGFKFGHSVYSDDEVSQMISDVTAVGGRWSAATIISELGKRGVSVGVNRATRLARNLGVIVARRRYGTITLSDGERAWLERTDSFNDAEAKRANIVLELAVGRTVKETAMVCGVSPSFVTCIKRVVVTLGVVDAVQNPHLLTLRRGELINLASGGE